MPGAHSANLKMKDGTLKPTFAKDKARITGTLGSYYLETRTLGSYEGTIAILGDLADVLLGIVGLPWPSSSHESKPETPRAWTPGTLSVVLVFSMDDFVAEPLVYSREEGVG